MSNDTRTAAEAAAIVAAGPGGDPGFTPGPSARKAARVLAAKPRPDQPADPFAGLPT